MNEDEVKKLIKDEVGRQFGTRLVGDTPTDSNQLVPKKYIDNFIHISSVYAGAVNDGGTAIFLPSGWTSSNDATGAYTVNHDLTNTSYTVVATVMHATNTRACSTSIASGSFRVRIGNAGNTGGENNAFNFIVASRG